eukprot:CAMPEP_0172563668 /NCGR_PEP_ID=MMETSP1067-20121228/101467_1 /TAXON_ID=265564 ORGANISM="Thalassiosira punctigera, Strain Tpunct2005C2" /NCGR_SAMPLE_ID=MMETSP1067 /ASSEMBLY_ACC=CAM_ASM_000444 /LENGTH=114 /DNA_ID=CAMNT_0013354159 /DNA_START=34 /DNA_END=374 /DNA_ORIENTATION=+
MTSEPPAIETSCATNTDCAVKNVGNCCGSYLQCANKDFTPDLNATAEWCKANDIESECGWIDIRACVCEGGSCAGVQCDGVDGSCRSDRGTAYNGSEIIPTWPGIAPLDGNNFA